MKKLKNIISGIVALVFFVSCEKGIDPLTQIDPGADESAPVVVINYPTEGTQIKVLEAVTSITIDFEVTDDIEVASIAVSIDGNNVGNFSSFKDYRRVIIDDFTYDTITDGEHVLTVTATDLDGKTTSVSVNFTKEPAYTPLFDGEVFYMPFDGNYTDLISITTATEVGSPGFAGESVLGTNAYAGAQDSYLTFPAEGLLSQEFSGAFWYKVNGSPDRAGILVIGGGVDDRTTGLRLFREGNADEQRIKLNVGTGTEEVWNDGGVIDVTAGEWVHVAFTISPTENTIYFNGVEMLSSVMPAAIDWTGSETITIGAGGENFSYWDHLSDYSPIDELRLFNKALTESEIQNMISVTNPYEPEYDGETFYMPFDDDNKELISNAEATVIGTTGFSGDAVEGSNAFEGATDSYLTFPAEGLLSQEFSGTFWYKVNGSPDRAGILVIGGGVDDRTTGMRLFREGNADEQRIKLNVGTGTGEVWNDGGVIDVTAGEWVHVAFTISETQNKIYFNGVETLSSDMAEAINWAGSETITIGAGGENFSYWDHLSDLSFIDELRLFNKSLTQPEIQAIIDGTD